MYHYLSGHASHLRERVTFCLSVFVEPQSQVQYVITSEPEVNLTAGP